MIKVKEFDVFSEKLGENTLVNAFGAKYKTTEKVMELDFDITDKIQESVKFPGTFQIPVETKRGTIYIAVNNKEGKIIALQQHEEKPEKFRYALI